jgi:ubiquinone/menaquinone biosynthesis C-methylase UbiE
MSAKTFDELARGYDEDPRRQQTAEAVFQAILRLVPLSKEMEVLECGAGTGLLTVLLAPLVKRILATDASEGMLLVLREKRSRLGLCNVETDLYDPTGQSMESSFGLLVASMLLHHIPDTEGVLRRFYGSLTLNGWVAIADLEEEDGSFHSPGMPKPAHYGFNRSNVVKSLEAAGFCNVYIETVHVVVKNERQYPIFLAVAKRGQ